MPSVSSISTPAAQAGAAWRFRAPSGPAPAAGRWGVPRRGLSALAAMALLWLGIEFYYICLGPNFHVLLPGRVYRSSQLTLPELSTAIRRYGLRSVINLRGCCPDQDWYVDETALAAAQGLTHVDVNLSSYMPPNPEELRKLAAALATAPEPILIHCRQGADRTSLAAALALLLKTDATVDDARGQFSWRFAHAPFGKAQSLDEAFERYPAWLAERGETHTPARLRGWIAHEYRPEPFWGEIEPIAMPEALLVGRWATARVRVTNRSRETWRFMHAGHLGVQLAVTLEDDGPKPDPIRITAGQFDHELKPGESLIFNVALPPRRRSGPVTLRIDLEDQKWCLFSMVGSPPLEKELMTWPWPLKPPCR